MWRYLKWGTLTTVILILVLFFHYTLPQHTIVRVVGTEVKRTDIGSGWFWAGTDTGTGDNQSRDVRFINTVRANGNTLVFRNEDTQWGWPPYFKFGSADLAAQAANEVSTATAPIWVSVRHYGWRSTWFSIYPNALSMKVVEGPDARIIPWFNIVFFVLLGVAWLTFRRLFINWRKRRIDPVVAEIGEDLGNSYEALSDKVEDAGEVGRGAWARVKGWFGRK